MSNFFATTSVCRPLYLYIMLKTLKNNSHSTRNIFYTTSDYNWAENFIKSNESDGSWLLEFEILQCSNLRMQVMVLTLAYMMKFIRVLLFYYCLSL